MKRSSVESKGFIAASGTIPVRDSGSNYKSVGRFGRAAVYFSVFIYFSGFFLKVGKQSSQQKPITLPLYV